MAGGRVGDRQRYLAAADLEVVDLIGVYAWRWEVHGDRVGRRAARGVERGHERIAVERCEPGSRGSDPWPTHRSRSPTDAEHPAVVTEVVEGLIPSRGHRVGAGEDGIEAPHRARASLLPVALGDDGAAVVAGKIGGDVGEGAGEVADARVVVGHGAPGGVEVDRREVLGKGRRTQIYS